jgi:hypothetical protein
MSGRPWHRPPPLLTADPAAVLDYELAQEKAAAFGRLGRQFEAALAALEAFDRDHPPASGHDADRKAARVALVNAAGHALWCFVVQREACGLRDSRQVLRDYRVPPDVVARMGISRSPKAPRGA